MPRLIPAAAVLALAALVAASPVAASKPAPVPGPVFTPSELPYPFSSAVQVGDVLYLSAQLGAEPGYSDTSNIPQTLPAFAPLRESISKLDAHPSLSYITDNASRRTHRRV